MTLRSNIELRRCRPLLGTFVEIAAHGKDRQRVGRAIEAAFDAVARVHRLMSFHDPDSDVSRMNRHAFPKGVIVHPWTWKVMLAAQAFARESNGVFDVTIASKANAISWGDIFLRRNCEVFFRRGLIVDLGGIAKGFAVDRAVAALKENGATAGIVNAGGDLRVFGSTSREVHLRDPISPTQFSGMLRLRNRAAATSANYFSPRALIDGQTRGAMTRQLSVSVAAADCMTADALTKIVFALREKSAPLLKRHGADALLLERDGSPSWTFQSLCVIHDRTR
jgi:thiamine biosynthesis lipoprotein